MTCPIRHWWSYIYCPYLGVANWDSDDGVTLTLWSGGPLYLCHFPFEITGTWKVREWRDPATYSRFFLRSFWHEAGHYLAISLAKISSSAEMKVDFTWLSRLCLVRNWRPTKLMKIGKASPKPPNQQTNSYLEDHPNQFFWLALPWLQFPQYPIYKWVFSFN